MNVAHDFNGDFFVVGGAGEVEEKVNYQAVWIFRADSAIFSLGVVVDANAHTAAIERTIKLNYWKLRGLPDPDRPAHDDAMKIAYLRTLGLVKGLGDPAANLATHHVKYSDIEILPDDHQAATSAKDGAAIAAKKDGLTENIPDYGDAVNIAWRAATKKKLTNLVCMIAFFMRTRGHHWTEDVEERYCAVWKRCLYEVENIGLNWKMVSRHSFHYIYPDVLDDFWRASVESARCAGALAKRFDSYAAGTAAVGACVAGANDVAVVFPKIRDIIPGAFKELDRCVAALSAHRWTGSINRRFYDGPALTVNEKLLGALAAVILAALETFQASAKLRDSLALKRVAENAPITGSIIATTLNKASQDDRMVAFLFDEEEELD